MNTIASEIRSRNLPCWSIHPAIRASIASSPRVAIMVAPCGSRKPYPGQKPRFRVRAMASTIDAFSAAATLGRLHIYEVDGPGAVHVFGTDDLRFSTGCPSRKPHPGQKPRFQALPKAFVFWRFPPTEARNRSPGRIWIQTRPGWSIQYGQLAPGPRIS